MAASLNKVLLMGNLTREPELRYTPGTNSAVCEFGIAINRRFIQNGQEKDETCFLDIVVWGKQAESCSRFLQKGSSVFIEGRLAYDTWTEKETQKKRSRIRITAERVQFLNGSRRDDAGGQDAAEEDPFSSGYESPRPQYSRPQNGGYGNQGQARYSRQQYDAAPHQPAPRPQHQAAPMPPAPENDPLEDVDDIPF